MRHLCKICRQISISDEAVADIKSLVSEGDVFHPLKEPPYPGTEYLRLSAAGTTGQRPCHLCALLLRSLKDQSKIGTSEKDDGLPQRPISLDVRVRGEEIALVARFEGGLGNPLVVSVGSG